MKKNWIRYVAVFSLATFTGAALLQTSQDVQRAESELRTVRNALESERESIRVLEAEWGYLNNPARLEGLASQYLDLEPPVPGSTLETPASLPDPFVPVIPSIKPFHESAPDIVVQPVSASSPISSSVLKPKAKPALKTPESPAKEKPAAPPDKNFNDLLKQYGGAP
jgi:hypothetical protein